MSKSPELFILSFSNIASDARVLKQIRFFTATHRVVSIGFGDSPSEVDEHVRLRKFESKFIVLLRAVLIRLHWYSAAYWLTPSVREVRKKLRGRTFDAMLANDLDSAGAALSVARPSQVHLDLHEYWLGLHDNIEAWVKLRRPYYSWQLRKYASRVTSVTTVSDVIARRYLDEFGIKASIVANASMFRDLPPSIVSRPLRIVHSGGSQPSRRIENMMHAVAQSQDATLDLLLVGGGTDYFRSLEELARSLGERIRILPPVRPDVLVETLNQYDVGLHVLPPTNTNNALALPNKFFDYVQARLALVIGPTASMADLLSEYDLGVVSPGFEVPELTRVIDEMSSDKVSHFKQQSHLAARPLSAEPQNAVWGAAIDKILSGASR